MAKPKIKLGVTRRTEYVEGDKKEVNVLEDNESKRASKLITSIQSKNDEDTSFSFKLVPFQKIRFSSENDFNTSEEECRSKGISILENGMIHSLLAVYDLEDDSYTLLSGEKRVRGCSFMKDDMESGKFNPEQEKLYESNIKPFFEKGFPCSVRTGLSRLEQKFLINAANVDVTRLTPTELANKIKEQKEIRIALAEERGEKPKKVTKEVANAFGITQRQVQKYNRINEGLIPELMELFQSEQITVNEGSHYASLTEEEQKQIVNIIKSGRKVNEDELAILKAESQKNKQQIAHLQNKLSAAQDEKDNLQRKFQADLQASLEESRKNLEAELKQSAPDPDSIQKLQEKISETERQLANQQEATSKASKELKKKEAEISQLQNQLNEAKKPLSDSEKNKLLAELKLEALQKEVTRALKDLQNGIDQYRKVYGENNEIIQSIVNEMVSVLKLK